MPPVVAAVRVLERDDVPDPNLSSSSPIDGLDVIRHPGARILDVRVLAGPPAFDLQQGLGVRPGHLLILLVVLQGVRRGGVAVVLDVLVLLDIQQCTSIVVVLGHLVLRDVVIQRRFGAGAEGRSGSLHQFLLLPSVAHLASREVPLQQRTLLPILRLGREHVAGDADVVQEDVGRVHVPHDALQGQRAHTRHLEQIPRAQVHERSLVDESVLRLGVDVDPASPLPLLLPELL
mmetsp:Transcript_21886/g.75265  ORF Transcript_21886/g.75265 Transcript_21886/m.75265 type:complete len:233 (+) Transcript_21886:2411-3109(+)